MGIETGMYQNIPQTQINLPSPMDAAKTAMSLSQMGMQQQQMRLQMQTRQAMMDAYAQNTDANGNVNQQGVLSQLHKTAPMAAIEAQSQMAALNKQQAEAQSAQTDAAQKAMSALMPKMQYLAGLPEDKRAAAYPSVRKDLIQQGAIRPEDAPEQYDAGHFQQAYAGMLNTEQYLKNRLTQSETGKNQAEAALAPAKLAGELYGRSSPNATVSNQYDNDGTVKTVKGSQVAMGQMLKNFTDKSPQGDASLVLNAFKIKFPNAPDVNSLAELAGAQGVTDRMKSWVNQQLQGVKDDNTRANLMRDGIATYEANVDSLRGAQKKFYNKAVEQNIPGANSIVAEPAVDETYGQAMGLKKKLGPYVPPTQRGGSILGSIGKMVGLGGAESATASDKPAAPKYGAGSIVMVGGKHYTVGPDGDSLVPVKGKR